VAGAAPRTAKSGRDENLDENRGQSFSPRTLIVTVLGAFGRNLGSWVAVSDLIDLMQELGVGAQAVRASVSRLKKRGFLLSERIDGVAGYRLTPHAETILARGDRRIYRTWQPTREADWIVVVFSVPESERERRHVLRSRLSWLGFGNAAPGVWVAPPHLEEEALDMIEAEGLTAYVSLFRSRYIGLTPISEAVGRWWDLRALEELYEEFIEAFSSVAKRHGRGMIDPQIAFADYVQVLSYWRVLPFLDPGLPPEMLPRNWSGERASALFMKLHTTLSGPALRHVRQVTERS
jgi:phenylacetic acid degradation operon negative regulatory protein